MAALLEAGADINRQNGGVEWTALMKAAWDGNDQVVQFLRDRGADLRIRAADGRTAAEIAEDNFNFDTARILREK